LIKKSYRSILDDEERSALKVREDKTPRKCCLINKRKNSEKTLIQKVPKSEIRLK